jgi:hypothetical protein
MNSMTRAVVTPGQLPHIQQCFSFPHSNARAPPRPPHIPAVSRDKEAHFRSSMNSIKDTYAAGYEIYMVGDRLDSLFSLFMGFLSCCCPRLL